MELELEEARTELSKRASHHPPPSVEHDDLQQQLQEKDLALETLRSEFKQTLTKMEEKERLLMENDEQLPETRLNMLENEKLNDTKFPAEKSLESTIETLTMDVKKLRQQKAFLESQLDGAKTARETHLLEVATNREKVREMEGLVEDYRNRIEEVR